MSVMELVNIEREKQFSKWGAQNHTLDKWMLILGEEVGEACKAVLEMETSSQDFQDEIVQIAAVCFAILEERYHWTRQ